jgi:tetrapyrrole methylase family protein/MazG family protein
MKGKVMSEKDTIQKLIGKECYGFNDLVDIMTVLRSEQGCPWDREQTHLSIRENLIEEAYEVVEGIDNSDAELLKEELGDLMFQIVFHAQLEKEQGTFDVSDVIDGVSRKMVHRHPHIFADRKLDTTDQVLDAWDKIKAEEKSRVSLSDKLQSIPRQLPALVRAQKVAEKAIKYQAVTDTAEQAIASASAALDRLRDQPSSETAEDNLGRLLLAVSVLAERLDVSAERALTYAVDRQLEAIKSKE